MLNAFKEIEGAFEERELDRCEAWSMKTKPKLHQHLIREILLKLPVKSLVRFKCVSKSWLSMISNVNFAKLHYDLIASSHNPQLVFSVSIVDSSKAQIQYVHLEGSLEVHYVNLVSPFLSSQEEHDINVLGVCRGFILLGHGPKINKWEYPYDPLSHENLLVWNPSIGIHRTLTYSEFGSILRCLPNHPPIRACYGLEYDTFTDDYFVVIAWIHLVSRFIERLELFSMRTNSWRQCDAINGFPCSKLWFRPDFSIFNGAIHWLAMHDGQTVKAIIAFDLIERNCSKIPLPHDCFVLDWTPTLEVIGGCLCLLCQPREPTGFAVLWMMKEYKVESSWTKCNYVPQHATPFLDPDDATPIPRFYFSPIYFTKAGQIVGDSSIGLAKLNDKGELLHCQRVYEHCHIYTESLLSLPTNSGQLSKDDQN